jgi:hypothetical protein
VPAIRPTHPDACEHGPNLIKVAMARVAGSWSAVCIGCLGQWLYTDDVVPESVRAAVQAAIEMVSGPPAEHPAASQRSRVTGHRLGRHGPL